MENREVNTITNRYEIMALIEAQMCNPNGDPDMANMPRMDLETNIGIITDAAFKARMRSYVKAEYGDIPGYSILFREANDVNRDIAEAVLTTNNKEKMKKTDNKDVPMARKFMCDKYWDVRTFGAVLSTGLNAGQVTGPAQVAMSLSVDPIEPEESSITRRCYTSKNEYSSLEEYDKADADYDPKLKRTMGKKTYIPYGLYVLKMSVSPCLAEKTGFSEEDFRVLLESLMQMYSYGISSSKKGMSVLSPVIVFKHVGTNDPETNPAGLSRERRHGCVADYKLHDMLTITRKENVDFPRNRQDYDIELHMEDLPAGVVCGLKKAPYSDVEQLDTNETIDLLNVK